MMCCIMANGLTYARKTASTEATKQLAETLAPYLHPGDVVEIPAGVKHWHGAARNSWFSHLAIEVPGVGTGNEWLEPVDAAEYDALA